MTTGFGAVLGHVMAFRRPDAPVTPTSFSFHNRSGYKTVLATVLIISCIEIAALDLVVRHFSVWTAWALAAVTIYGMLWLFADYQAVRLYPIRIEAGVLSIRIGLRVNLTIPLEVVDRVGPAPLNLPRRRAGYLRCTVGGNPSRLIELSQPVIAGGLLHHTGITSVGLSVDDGPRFRDLLIAEVDRARAS